MALREGFRTVPIERDAADSIGVRVIVREAARGADGHFVILRSLPYATVFLGALADAEGRAIEPLEIWFRCGGNDDSAGMDDDEWSTMCRALSAICPGEIIATGWEHRDPDPLYVDTRTFTPTCPASPATGKPWRLCADDAVLTAHGLPPYSGNRHRYLYLPEAAGDETVFIPVTPGAPENEWTGLQDGIIPDPERIIPLNPSAQRVLVRRTGNTSVEAFADLVADCTGGGRFRPYDKDSDLADVFGVPGVLPETGRLSSGSLFSGREGSRGRIAEVLHLKLRLLADIVDCVADMVRATGRPLLNLAPDRFRARVAEDARSMPFLWTARVSLADPGAARAVAGIGADMSRVFFLRGGGEPPSIYLPADSGMRLAGTGMLRIRRVNEEADGALSLEGTLRTRELASLADGDLLSFTIAPGGEATLFYAVADETAAPAAGEFRFRSFAKVLPAGAAELLRSGEAAVFTNVSFTKQSLLTVSEDLYSLAVIATRILFVSGDASIAEKLDDILALAHQLAGTPSAGTPDQQVAAILASDPRWQQALGPDILLPPGGGADETCSPIPDGLWCRVLALVARMFPGIGPGSFLPPGIRLPAEDFPGVLSAIGEEAAELVIQSRALVVPDMWANAEVAGVIDRLLDEL